MNIMSGGESIEDMLTELESDEFSMCKHLHDAPAANANMANIADQEVHENNAFWRSLPSQNLHDEASQPYRQLDGREFLSDDTVVVQEENIGNPEFWPQMRLDQDDFEDLESISYREAEFSLQQENNLLKRTLATLLDNSSNTFLREDASPGGSRTDSLSSCKTSHSSISTNLASASQNCKCENSEIRAPQSKVKADDDVTAAQKRKDAISSTKTVPKSKGLFEIVGLDEAKSITYEALIMPMKFPHLFDGMRKPTNSILLYGPPGTGKTHLAHSVAAEVSADFYCISSSDLLSVWLGESEKLIKELFNLQHDDKKIIVFIDEIDSLCRARSSDEAEHTRRLKTELLVQMDTSSNNDIFVISATNCPWDLDKAFLRRFQRKIYVGPPDRASRHSFLTRYESMMNGLVPIDWSEILDRTDGFTGSDLEQLAQCALIRPVRELRGAKFWKFTDDGKLRPTESDDPVAIEGTLDGFPPHLVETRHVILSDFVASLDLVLPTISGKDMEKYEKFSRHSFG